MGGRAGGERDWRHVFNVFAGLWMPEGPVSDGVVIGAIFVALAVLAAVAWTAYNSGHANARADTITAENERVWRTLSRITSATMAPLPEQPLPVIVKAADRRVEVAAVPQEEVTYSRVDDPVSSLPVAKEREE